MKLWIDDVRPAPEGYVWTKSVNSAKHWIEQLEFEQQMFYDSAIRNLKNKNLEGYHYALEMCNRRDIELLDIDHDAGEYAECGGGDYIKLLDWLEETGRNYPIRIHSMNPVGVANMRSIIERNGWKEIK
jgi:hypothetical protein